MFYSHATFSRDLLNTHLITRAYGDLKSAVAYNAKTHTVSRIATLAANVRALRPILWEVEDPKVTRDSGDNILSGQYRGLEQSLCDTTLWATLKHCHRSQTRMGRR